MLGSCGHGKNLAILSVFFICAIAINWFFHKGRAYSKDTNIKKTLSILIENVETLTLGTY